ncbi:hypothetical protein LSAT2_026186, partial [Lamellibrachia satsuma]
ICSGCGRLHGLAIDPVERKLYFSNYEDRNIEVVGVDGSGRKTITNCTGNPLGLTINLKERVGSIQLKANLHASLNLGSYNTYITYSMAYLHGNCRTSGRSGTKPSGHLEITSRRDKYHRPWKSQLSQTVEVPAV